MGMYKRFIENYLEQLLPLCSEEQFGQDAIEWAIFSGHVAITHDLQTDLRHIMGLPGHPETGEYDNICDVYHSYCAQHEAIDQQRFLIAA